MTQNNACSHKEYCISLVPIFNHLEKEQMKEIMDSVQSVHYKKGEMIYRAGEESSSLYIVHRGQIKIYRISETGKEILIRILNPGDFTGEYALFNQSNHENYAEALKDTQVCMIQRAHLQQFLLKYPTISLKILSEFSTRLESTEKQTTRVATEKVDTRIALFLAECADGEEDLEFTLPMNKKDIASYLGTTPETLSRKLTEFEERELIQQKPRKRIQILDFDGLLQI